ncbi:MAG: flavin reductase [Phycisphaerae bacterium]|jgi:flavin reductase (DIM6/NTAB) family NADH-FMN oxidoreductase RutF
MIDDHKQQIGRSLGLIPSGCFVLTARAGERATGMLASWVQQAGFEPPAVSVAVRSGRPVQQLIEASGRFVLNLVPEERGPMFKHFGKGFAAGEPAFTGLAVREIPEGVVVEACAAYLACRLMNHVDSGDHRIYLGEVVAGGTLRSDPRPYVHIRADGLKY